MAIGYDPDRVRALGQRTRDAIDDCAALASTDPAAEDAVRTVRLTRRNLEDLWMPAVRDIERSEAMTSWRRADLASRPGPHAPTWMPLSPLSDRELIDEITWMDAFVRSSRSPAPGDLEALARETARRVRSDAAFADHLVRLAPSTPLVALLVDHARFPPGHVRRLVVALAEPVGPYVLAKKEVGRRALESAMVALLDDPAACLDALAEPAVLDRLATPNDLDPDIVMQFVVNGLHAAVVADAGRLVDSYRVLTQLTTLANSSLDDGMSSATALGVAVAMVGYIETLAPAIRHEGSAPVLVVLDSSLGLDVELGTYDDVVDLVGAVLRDPAAQAALGTVLGGFTTAVVTGLGADVTRRPGVEHIARFADLIGDAARTEQVELFMEAAAEESRVFRIGGAIGFGVDLALTATGVGATVRGLAAHAVRVATDRAARTDPAELPSDVIPAGIHDLITVTSASVVVDDPGLWTAAGLAPLSRADRIELGRRIAEITAETDPAERARHVRRLEHRIASVSPALADHLARIRSAPGMDELTEARSAVGAD